MSRLREQARSHRGYAFQCGSELAREGARLITTSDRIKSLGHIFRANIGHRAGYCIELDSHKVFAA
jgi:uncharacterized membrane protein